MDFFSELIVMDIEQLGATKDSLLILHVSIYYLHTYHRDFSLSKNELDSRSEISQGPSLFAWMIPINFLQHYFWAIYRPGVFSKAEDLESLTHKHYVIHDIEISIF